MNLVFFCHPPFLGSQSMTRFAHMVGEAMRQRGHSVRYWAPQDHGHRLFAGTRLAKWAGYVDQYIVFPIQVRRMLRTPQPADTVYVFCDQALGPWVPLVAHLPHVVHAHDLLALRSALGLIPQNPTGWSGRVYQRYIRWGFRQARHFISVSARTRDELHHHGGVQPLTSTVVHNGLNRPLAPMPWPAAQQRASAALPEVNAEGALLHVGGGQWYKNTAGVIRLYNAYAARHARPLPLIMVSPEPHTPDVLAALADAPAAARVVFRQGLDDDTLCALYTLASALLFPSLAEGFGWPIVEAQACGCLVLTTNDAPMNEIGGPHAHYLPLLRAGADVHTWARDAARQLDDLLDQGTPQDPEARASRMAWAARFSAERALNAYEAVYRAVAVAPEAAAELSPESAAS